MFKNRKLMKEFIENVRVGKYTISNAGDALEKLPIRVIRNIGKEIIYSNSDRYNKYEKGSELIWFDGLARWQKEHFIKQRLYDLY